MQSETQTYINARLEEETRLNLVKAIVDSACVMIVSGCLDAKQRTVLADWVKAMVSVFIPGQEDKYDMIYDSRLKRLLEQHQSSSDSN